MWVASTSKGKQLPKLSTLLTKAYAKILHNPIIAVDLTNFQAPQFTIFGEVGKPGQYQLRYDTTVSQAIAIGGGFLPSAKSQVFSCIGYLRLGGGEEIQPKGHRARQERDGGCPPSARRHDFCARRRLLRISDAMFPIVLALALVPWLSRIPF